MTTAPELASRRTEVARLHAEKHSVRQIAEKLGVSPATVQRDIDALRRNPKVGNRDTETASGQDTNPSVSPVIAAVALLDPPQTETPGHPTETGNRDTETPFVSSVTLPLDAALLDDLATLTRNGRTAEDVVRRALAFAAHAHRQAWAAGTCPPTVDPIIDRFTIKPYPKP
ncbi:helix-turn-helix domain-containing protein [Streptomyces sp. NPDC004520]|uniref:helix-turn-helix domain-containing protein n=1 Tax=Streptomyces sp. NPDC004520 TaxID=3364702 RepID=UPI00367C2B8D